MERDSSAKPQNSLTAKRSVSVVMPTFNRSHYLPLSIGALLEEEEVKEVIVVDDCSSDSTPELLAQIGAQSAVLRTIRNRCRKGSAFSRNLGFEAASGTSVLMIDDDVVMESGSLSVLCLHREVQQAGAASSRMVLLRRGESPKCFSPRSPGSALVKPGTLEVDFESQPGADVPTVLTTPIMLFYRDCLRGLRYDTRLRGNAWREETDFQIEYARAGGRMVYCPHAVGYHLAPQAGGQRSGSRLNYEFSIFRNNYYFSKKHGDRLRADFPEVSSISRPLMWALKCELERVAGYGALLSRRVLGA